MRTLVLILISLSLAPVGPLWGAEQLPALPAPVSNNAIAAVKINGQVLVYSLMGLGAEKSWKSVTNNANALNLKFDRWTSIRPVPGSGRLGAAAAAVREQILLMGGFVPDQSGREAIVSDLTIYDPVGLRWYRGPDLLVAVRDAVAGVYRDRYVYLMGGFSDNGPTNQVQVYDTEAQRWFEGSPLPGTGVFGHAGSVVGDNIVFVDGAKKNPAGGAITYIPSDECWLGKIDRHDPKKIEWKQLPAHPGTGRYRIGAGGSEREQKIYFAGGSQTIYDYTGIDLEGKPAEPSPTIFAFDLKTDSWDLIQENAPNATMDHRGLVVTSDGLLLVGGMAKGPVVVPTVELLPKKH
jgi:N-acetylneuraminic acid mutarotase